jgi:hypothetical protein
VKQLLVVLMAIAAACAAEPPRFNDAADMEQGHDRPCYIDGRLQPGWHQCQMRDTAECCPDGASCSGDDFVPHPPPGYCRWRGQ